MTDFVPPQATNPQVEASRSDKDRVMIFDTTLRDGEQSPGASMTHEEKLEVAASSTRWASTSSRPVSQSRQMATSMQSRKSAKLVKNAVVCGLARADPKDIDRAGEAVRHAKRGAHPHLHLHLARCTGSFSCR